MFLKSDKKRLYWLIDQYLLGQIKSQDFCYEFHDCYDLELDLDSLTELEHKIFSDLSLVAGRFSSFEKDLKKYPAFFFNEEQLREKVQEAVAKLKSV